MNMVDKYINMIIKYLKTIIKQIIGTFREITSVIKVYFSFNRSDCINLFYKFII